MSFILLPALSHESEQSLPFQLGQPSLVYLTPSSSWFFQNICSYNPAVRRQAPVSRPPLALNESSSRTRRDSSNCRRARGNLDKWNGQNAKFANSTSRQGWRLAHDRTTSGEFTPRHARSFPMWKVAYLWDVTAGARSRASMVVIMLRIPPGPA